MCSCFFSTIFVRTCSAQWCKVLVRESLCSSVKQKVLICGSGFVVNFNVEAGGKR